MDLLWPLAAGCPQVILEANFRPGSDHPNAHALWRSRGGSSKIYCHCTPEEAERRFRERAERERHHPAHSMKTMSAELLKEFDRPIGLSPVIDVDTESPVDPAVDALEVAARIRRHWPDLAK